MGRLFLLRDVSRKIGDEFVIEIFKIIPSGFFNPLSSGSNNEVNASCLIEIYEQFENEVTYRISKKTIRDILASFILDNHIKADSDMDVEDGRPSDVANSFLRKFSSPDVGWLVEETDDATYEKYISMTEVGIALAEFLINIEKPEKVEYSTYIYNIYNTLNNETQWKDSPYINCLKPVYKNAKALSKSLKSLSTFIRKTIEDLIKEVSLETLTENLLSYCNGDFIKEYARLTKQQNIHIYRRAIKEKLDQLTNEPDKFNALLQECVSEEGLSERDAEIYIYDMIDNTKSFLSEDYDRIMKDIKHKINMHLHIAVGRIRFIRNNGTDNRGSVEQVIKLLKESTSELDMRDELPEEYQNLFRLDRNEYLDLVSVKYPRKNRAIRKATVSMVELPTDEDIDAAKRQQEMEAYNPYSKEKMKMYLEELFSYKKELHSDDIPHETHDELLAAVSAVAYGEENGYNIEVEDGYVESNNLMLRKFVITKK